MKNNKGGKVLASGGFGCVFSPQLKCKGKTLKKRGISKLMKKEYAIDEYEEIQKYKKILQHIPNYTDYFLLYDINICQPAKLTKADLSNFTKKCTALPKDDITKANINDSLDKMMILNMPNGGIPVNEFIKSSGKLAELNQSLISLLTNGIVPMNKANIYHCDIKETNVLVDTDIKTRLIDWGLSTEYIPYKNNKFPSTWRNRPLQFNVPFSVIIFSDTFVETYTEYIKKGGKTTEDALRPFVTNYLNIWFKERGLGHFETINEIMYLLFNHDIDPKYENKRDLIKSKYTMEYITNYIMNVLVNFTKFRDDGTLNLRYYLDKVFIKIIDVWGFIITYLPILELLASNYDELTPDQLKLFNDLKYIYITYLYTPTNKPINIKALVSSLNKLGTHHVISKGKTMKRR
jgi:serine/threonine protein kinase